MAPGNRPKSDNYDNKHKCNGKCNGKHHDEAPTFQDLPPNILVLILSWLKPGTISELVQTSWKMAARIKIMRQHIAQGMLFNLTNKELVVSKAFPRPKRCLRWGRRHNFADRNQCRDVSCYALYAGWVLVQSWKSLGTLYHLNYPNERLLHVPAPAPADRLWKMALRDNVTYVKFVHKLAKIIQKPVVKEYLRNKSYMETVNVGDVSIDEVNKIQSTVLESVVSHLALYEPVAYDRLHNNSRLIRSAYARIRIHEAICLKLWEASRKAVDVGLMNLIEEIDPPTKKEKARHLKLRNLRAENRGSIHTIFDSPHPFKSIHKHANLKNSNRPK